MRETNKIGHCELDFVESKSKVGDLDSNSDSEEKSSSTKSTEECDDEENIDDLDDCVATIGGGHIDCSP